MVQQIDARGPRFVAMLTTAVLAAVLLASPGDAATVLLAGQAVVFGVGAVAGIQHTPYSWIFRRLVRPRLSPPTDFEDPGPPRFAQAVGLGFTLAALLGYLSGATLVGAIATGFALGAAFLNAVFGLCLGCEVYLLVRRAAPTPERDAGTEPVATKG
jgi:hypothetical protein